MARHDLSGILDFNPKSPSTPILRKLRNIFLLFVIRFPGRRRALSFRLNIPSNCAQAAASHQRAIKAHQPEAFQLIGAFRKADTHDEGKPLFSTLFKPWGGSRDGSLDDSIGGVMRWASVSSDHIPSLSFIILVKSML